MKMIAITTEKAGFDFDSTRKVTGTLAKIRKRSERILDNKTPKTKRQLLLEMEGLRNKLEAAEQKLQDLTNQKQSEKALRISETGYRHLFEMAQDGILILDAQTGRRKALSEIKTLKRPTGGREYLFFPREQKETAIRSNPRTKRWSQVCPLSSRTGGTSEHNGPHSR